MKLSAGENRILTPVAPPPDRPARESYQIFHDVLAGAVLEWRNQYERNAERAEAEARAEEQRQKAEHEAAINARLRKQKRMLIASLIAASTLLIIVVGLGFFIFRTAGELSQLQIAFSQSDERVKQLLAQAADAQKEVVGYYEEAQRLAQLAVVRAAAGDVDEAKNLNSQAANASKQADAAVAKVAQINSAIRNEQRASADIRSKADALGDTLGGLATAMPTAAPPVVATPVAIPPSNPTATEPTRNEAPIDATTAKPPIPTPQSPAAGVNTIVKPPDSRYRDTYKRAIDAKNRRRWADARKLFEEAIAQNGVESTERIPISGFGNYEPYVPRYYLGLALSNLGDCPGAIENWQKSETDGVVKQTNLYSTLRSERAKCEKAK